MVRALKATGATPEEIAKTMCQAMGKGGASNEDIARVLASALADADLSCKSQRIAVFQTIFLVLTSDN